MRLALQSPLLGILQNRRALQASLTACQVSVHTSVCRPPPPPPPPPPPSAPWQPFQPPSPPTGQCGDGTALNAATNRCEIVCTDAGRRSLEASLEVEPPSRPSSLEASNARVALASVLEGNEVDPAVLNGESSLILLARLLLHDPEAVGRMSGPLLKHLSEQLFRQPTLEQGERASATSLRLPTEPSR